jgi:hypothetical protein
MWSRAYAASLIAQPNQSAETHAARADRALGQFDERLKERELG